MRNLEETRRDAPAMVTVFDHSLMTDRGRKKIAAWLRQEADRIERFVPAEGA
jgi:hypothetical protein